MKRKIFFLVLGIGIFIFARSPDLKAEENKNSGSITVQISGFKNTEGAAALLFFDSPAGFPKNKEKASRQYYSTLSSTRSSVKFEGVQFGTYAITVIHDENSNGELDTNWLGKPKEGIGVSKEIKGLFGPRFKPASFLLDKSSFTINIELKYLD
ncbi:MAG: DUF2141 domain-containing protein [Elusimicrobiota bacterium]